MNYLISKLKADRSECQKELVAIASAKIQMEWKLKYLDDLIAAGESSPVNAKETIADIAVRVLTDQNRLMSGTEIAEFALAGGLQCKSVQHARSKIAATVCKNMKGASPRFHSFGRGKIGLSSWRTQQEASAT